MRTPLILALASTLVLAGCGKSLTTERTTYETYGLLNAAKKNSAVCYEISAGNLIWSFILVETIVFPIYLVGFSLFNPVRLKSSAADTCGDD